MKVSDDQDWKKKAEYRFTRGFQLECRKHCKMEFDTGEDEDEEIILKD